MKSTILFITILFFSILNAQTVKVTSRQTLPEKGQFPVLNNAGDKILFTSAGYVGLKLFDMAKKTNTIISDEDGAGYEPQFSPDDKSIYFRKTTFVNNRRFNGIFGFYIIDNTQKELLKPQRFLNRIQPLTSGVMAFAGNALLKATVTKTITPKSYVSADDQLRIVVYDGNNIQYLNPLKMEEPRYIWVSLSPDNQNILFTALGKGTFICNLKGKILAELGNLNAPAWVNNKLVTGMEDKDDGHQIISSRIVVKDYASGKSSVISLPGQIALYPTAATKSNKIAWQTNNNEIEIVEISIQ
jgi:hypothetical protein